MAYRRHLADDADLEHSEADDGARRWPVAWLLLRPAKYGPPHQLPTEVRRRALRARGLEEAGRERGGAGRPAVLRRDRGALPPPQGRLSSSAPKHPSVACPMHRALRSSPSDQRRCLAHPLPIASSLPPQDIAVPIAIDNSLPDYCVRAEGYAERMRVQWQPGDRFRMFFGGARSKGRWQMGGGWGRSACMASESRRAAAPGGPRWSPAKAYTCALSAASRHLARRQDLLQDAQEGQDGCAAAPLLSVPC